MDWARTRKWTVIAVLGAAALAFLLILGFAIFYKTPTCTDRKQDGGETGIDCGGSCATLCSAEAQPASVRFARTLAQSGRTDLIAYIDNPNKDAYAKDVRLDIDIYLEDGHMLQKHAVLTLPADSSTPLFIPGIANSPVQQVFIAVDASSLAWTHGAGRLPPPKATAVDTEGAGNGERITAAIANQTAYPASQVPLVATVFGPDGAVLAASQTILPLLPAQGTAQAIFTWNEPFSAPAARTEIIPLVSLPQLAP